MQLAVFFEGRVRVDLDLPEGKQSYRILKEAGGSLARQS